MDWLGYHFEPVQRFVHPHSMPLVRDGRMLKNMVRELITEGGPRGTLRPAEAELAIVEEIAAALKEMGGRYVLPFRFRNERGNRTSHHLIFVSKDFKGYEIMKDIMSRESSTTNQGVPSFEYNPATRAYPLLFELSRPLDELEGQLLHDFAGRTLTMRQIYEAHSVDRPFLARHYKEALINLEAKGAIEADPPSPPRRKNTFADHVSVSFPPA